MKKEPLKRCIKCYYFKRYYIKGESQYNKTIYGNCSHLKKIVKYNNVCKSWCVNKNTHYVCKKTSLKVLNDLLNSLNSISQVLQEEHKKNDE